MNQWNLIKIKIYKHKHCWWHLKEKQCIWHYFHSVHLSFCVYFFCISFHHQQQQQATSKWTENSFCTRLLFLKATKKYSEKQFIEDVIVGLELSNG